MRFLVSAASGTRAPSFPWPFARRFILPSSKLGPFSRPLPPSFRGIYYIFKLCKVNYIMATHKGNPQVLPLLPHRLGKDLQVEFPGVAGFSPRNLEYMRVFASQARRGNGACSFG